MGHGDPQKIAIYGPLGSYPAPPAWWQFWKLAAYAAKARADREEVLSLVYSMLGTVDANIEMPTAAYDGGKVLGANHEIDLYKTANSGYFVVISSAPTP